MKFGTCRLCLLKKNLLRRSHIIPEFIFEQSGMYDEKHTFSQFTVEELLKGKKPKKPQKGYYEPDILCKECDGGIISGYEDYARKFFYGGLKGKDAIDVKKFAPMGGEVIISRVLNVNYKQFKLYALSVLFRASLSGNDRFKYVKLNLEYLEHLRMMIYSGDPGAINDFPFLIKTFATTRISNDIVASPTVSKWQGNNMYIFIFGGMVYFFMAGINMNLDHRLTHLKLPDDTFSSVVISPDNTMIIQHFSQNEGENFLFKPLTNRD